MTGVRFSGLRNLGQSIQQGVWCTVAFGGQRQEHGVEVGMEAWEWRFGRDGVLGKSCQTGSTLAYLTPGPILGTVRSPGAVNKELTSSAVMDLRFGLGETDEDK